MTSADREDDHLDALRMALETMGGDGRVRAELREPTQEELRDRLAMLAATRGRAYRAGAEDLYALAVEREHQIRDEFTRRQLRRHERDADDGREVNDPRRSP